MLEWLAATTGIELGRLVLEQVLDLSKPVLEGYVQDFFKDCLNSGVSRLNATALKTPMAEAVGYFIKRFIKELRLNDVPETSIQHHYQATIKKFVQDKAVRSILGKAFEKDCKYIDYAQLEQVWTKQYQVSGWQFPLEEFDWRGVCKEYVYEVKGIVKANPELRSLLETDLLEDIARNTAQLSPGFDVENYRHSLQSSYGYLKLYTLDSTDRVDAIKLWAMFIEQTVREALPPMRYDLPLDMRQKSEFSKNSDFLAQPTRKVLDAVADSQRAVILGDPGSGKSSLLQYLALEWVEGQQTSEVFKTSDVSKLPLLIELREFAITPSTNFLEFLHQGRGVDWQFDQQQLHQHLLEFPTLVMFDGLDEVFDRTTQSTVIDDIIRFSQQYPNAQILVTSRIIGYNPERLQQSGFRHFTIQSLDTDEIHEFIDRWYDLSMGSDPDKVRLKQRLKDAIANSKAIANLADNPLLLTMMAILNRRQELPRDRADLYDQASRVLLYHWDVDHKRLNLPMDAIGRREKQEMLRLIAYEMQAAEEGLKGNLISAEHLTRLLTNYLRDQGFSEPREKANRLIQQLRERNFILCYRGADTYGFMHRTFLEYFCAVEIVHRFEKQRTLTFEQLRDEVFGQHWQDETWHEVLWLICGMVDVKFVGEISNCLADQVQEKRFNNFFFAASCLLEVKNISRENLSVINLIEKMKELVKQNEKPSLAKDAAIAIIRLGKDLDNLAEWLIQCTELSKLSPVPKIAVEALIWGWRNDPNILIWIKNCVRNSENQNVRMAAVREISKFLKDHPDTIATLKDCAQNDEAIGVRLEASMQIANMWIEDLDILSWLKDRAKNDKSHFVRLSLKEKIKRFTAEAKPEEVLTQDLCFPPNSATFLNVLKLLSSKDECTYYPNKSIRIICDAWRKTNNLIDFLVDCVILDSDIQYSWLQDIRFSALKAIFFNFPTHSKALELLRDRAINDPNKQLREWAQEQLQQMEKQGELT